MLWPAQTTAFESEILAVGSAFAVTLAEAVALQLFELVAVTVKLNPPFMVLLKVAALVVLVKVPPLFDQL